MSEKAKEFNRKLKNYHTNIMVFIELFNLWVDMDIKERGQVIQDYQIKEQ